MGRGKTNKIGSNRALEQATDQQLRDLQALNSNNPQVLLELADEAARRKANRDIVNRISQAKFTEEGNGNWQFDIPDIGGGQVLDETGSTRALDYGNMPNQRTYSATAWTYDENGAPTITDLGMFNRRNQAQKAIKDALKGNRRGR